MESNTATFGAGLFSLSITARRVTPVVARTVGSHTPVAHSFSLLSSVLWQGCTMVTYSPWAGHVGWFQLCTTTNKAALIIGVQVNVTFHSSGTTALKSTAELYLIVACLAQLIFFKKTIFLFAIKNLILIYIYIKCLITLCSYVLLFTVVMFYIVIIIKSELANPG